MCNICGKTAVNDIETARKVLGMVIRKLTVSLGETSPTSPYSIPEKDIVLGFTDREEMELLSPGRHGPLEIHETQTSGLTRTSLVTVNGEPVRRRLDEIAVLHGLPAEHLAVVLAHELGHAFTFLNGFDGLSHSEEEGLAELFSHLWLEGRSTPEAEFRREVIEKNPNPEYGAGFRDAKRAMERHTLPRMLELMKRYGRFPI